MAVLADAERFALWAQWMQDNTGSIAITKAELRAALNAADQWAEDNAVSYNAAIPQPARGSLTATQKARILTYVVRRRFEIG